MFMVILQGRTERLQASARAEDTVQLAIPDKIESAAYEREAKNLFGGFSDITFLHTAMGLYSNLVTFHGPMGYYGMR